MESLRAPFFIVAVVLALVVVLVELGSLTVPPATDLAAAVDRVCSQNPPDNIKVRCVTDRPGLISDMAEAQQKNATPGLGIPYLALVDGVLLYMTLLMGLSLIIPARVEGRIQGIATLIFSILLILAAIVMILFALGKLILMVSLLLSVPFGTLAYLAIWGFFNRGTASVILGFLWLLKLAFGVCLVLAQQRFLQNKGLILLFLAALLANIVVSFLQGIVPGFLVSITDAIAAIVVAIIGVIMLILALIGSVIAIVKAIKPEV